MLVRIAVVASPVTLVDFVGFRLVAARPRRWRRACYSGGEGGGATLWRCGHVSRQMAGAVIPASRVGLGGARTSCARPGSAGRSAVGLCCSDSAWTGPVS